MPPDSTDDAEAPASTPPAPDARGLTTLGRIVSVDRSSPSAVLTCASADGEARLLIDALADDVLRLRLAPPDGTFRAHPSYAVDPATRWDGPSAWEVEKTAEVVTVQTAALSVRADRATGRLRVATTDGPVLVDDEAGVAWGDGRVAHSIRLGPSDRVFGLGDKALSLDRRGHAVEMWNTDAYKFGRGSDPLYKSIPFVLKEADTSAVGLFYDNSFRSRFDVGAERPDRLRWEAAGGAFDLYVLAAPAPLGVVARFARLTGRTPMLPRWALGYHQSRYSYRTEAEVRAVAAGFRQRGIPCDTLYFDIHHMRGYRVFTWDRAAFPDPPALLADLKRDGFTSVVIVDPGVKADDPDSDVYRSGTELGAFVRHPSGEVALGDVWPGTCAFPDVTRPDVRDWWGGLHAGLVRDGADGVWNDMNEPSVFGAPFDEGSVDAEVEAETLPDDVLHDFDGRGGTHAEAHNVYGMQMQRATFEGLRRLRPDHRPFTITRAAYAGSQRYGAAWTGDNSATWDHLRLAIEMCLSLGVSGAPFTGADVGGFVGHPSGELLARWTQVGALTPLFRNHSAVDTPRQEPWQFGEEVERVCREAIELRYRLLPTLYTALWEAHTEGLPMMRPLALVHPADETIRRTSPLGFYVGASLLAYPVVEEGQTVCEGYLPDSPGGWYDVATGEHHEGRQTLRTAAPLDRLPLYVRGGTVLPLGPVRQHTGEPVGRLALHVYPAPGRSETRLYDDAGDGHAHEHGGYWLGRFTVEDDGPSLTVTCAVDGHYTPAWGAWDVVVHGMETAPAEVHTDARPTPFVWDGEAVRFSLPVGAGFRLVRGRR